MRNGLKLSAILLASACLGAGARADIAVSANDAHSTLVNGVGGAVKDAPSDSAAVIDLSQSPPRIIGTVDVPASVAGPAQGVFVARDESFAIIPAGNRAVDGKIVPDNKVSVIDLSVSPPKVVQQVAAGMGANAVAVNPGGHAGSRHQPRRRQRLRLYAEGQAPDATRHDRSRRREIACGRRGVCAGRQDCVRCA